MVPFKRLDEAIERIKAIVLVENIKATRGGHKLSMENIIFLAEHFEADYLPGEPTDIARIREHAEEIRRKQEKQSVANTEKIQP